MKQAGFVAGPAGTAPAKTDLEVREIRTGIKPAFVTGLPPERQPLSRMIIADSLNDAHACKDDGPYRHEREMTLLQGQGAANSLRSQHAEPFRSGHSIDALDRQIQ